MGKNLRSVVLRLMIWILIMMTLSSGLQAEGSPAKNDLVSSFSPTGSIANNTAFKVTFTEPIVSRLEVGRVLPAEKFPFEVIPPIQAEGKWLDQRTFSASLLAPLNMATAYIASIKEDLKTFQGRNVGTGVYIFRTAAPSLESISATASDSNEINVRLNFNMPVLPSRLRGFLTITDINGRILRYSVSGAAASTVNASVTVNNLPDGKLNVRINAGLTAETGNLALEQDEIRRLDIKNLLRVTDLMAYSDGSVRCNTSLNADLDAAADFISVEPKVPFTLQHNYDGSFYIRGDFKPRERFVFTFKKGLPSSWNGVVLEEDHVQALIMPDLEPSIDLVSSGMYLSPVAGGRIPVELVNLHKLKVNLWRLYENNIPYVMRGDYTYFQRDLARRVYNKELSISLPFNEKVRRSIVLEDLLSGDVDNVNNVNKNGSPPNNRGLFLLALSNPDYDEWYETSQIVNLSDMGVVARLWEDGILVWVNTLSGLEPVAEANVKVYSYANQLLAEGKTGTDGVWHMQLGKVWDQGEDQAPYFVTISKGHDVTFVKLTKGLMSKEVFDTSGRSWLMSGYDASIFSARDIYRTGEQAPFKAVVRNYDHSTPSPFPVLFVVRDPLGRAVKRNTTLLSEEGGALFELDIPDSALTGVWTCSLFIPGDEEKSLGVMKFNVEDFAPPRIEVKLDTDADTVTPGGEISFGVTAKYLFGADGAGLRWGADFRAREGVFKPKTPKWAGYTFADETRSFSAVTESIILDEQLNSLGESIFRFSAPDDWQSVLDVTFTASVMEEGGRWVRKSLTLPYYPSQRLLGLAAPEGALEVGKDLTFRVASLTPKEEPVDLDGISAALYHVTWNYNLVEVDGYTRWQGSEELIKVSAKNVSTKNGTGEVTFKPDDWGSYVLKISDGDSNVSASLRFDAYGSGYAERGSQLVDRVEIDTDKEIYKIGDVAKVTLRAPFKGLALFNVEAFGLIDRRIVKIEGSETVVEVPVTAQMTPNAWCAAWLIRPVAEDETWGAHRAVGVKLLQLDTSGSRLDIKLDVPSKADPAALLPVAMTLTDSQGRPAKAEVALALVDEGVLGLTNFKTPDLVGHFLGKRRMNSNGYDIYDLLTPLESRNTELLHPSGGALMEAFAGAGAPRGQRFKILSLFEGMLSADETGIVKTELKLPEFSGRGRIFAVASSGNRHGMAEQMVQIARDIVTEVELPRFAAPGDVFTVPVTIFNSGEESRDVSIELSASEELSIDGHDGHSGNIMTASIPGKSSHRWDVTLRAITPGTGVYSVKTTWKEGREEGGKEEEKSYGQDIELPVRSPYPVVTISGSGFFESGDVTIDVDKKSFTGKVTGKLTLADTPLADITQAANFLANYPHGCLEQTISAAWPFLVLPNALSEIDPLLVNSGAVRQKTDHALTRIQSMQLYDGSFAKWPGSGYPYNWGSVYAAHFLVEARKAGVEYPEEMLKSSLNWLKQFLASIPGGSVDKYKEMDDFTTKAYAVYVLALNGEKPMGWIHHLKENKQNMWPSGRIWLAGTETLLDGRADALRALETTPITGAIYETLETNVRNAALLLSMWSEAEPKSAEAVKLVQMLLDSGKNNHWYSTQENAAVAMALGRYILKAGYEKGNLEGVLSGSDPEQKEIISFRSGEKASIEAEALPYSSLTLRTKGTGSGYYTWNVTGSPAAAPKPGRSGLSLDCVWKDESGETMRQDQPVPHGAKIFVTLKLTPALSARDLVVSYLLPAGMEIENPRLARLGDGEEREGNENNEENGVRYDVRDDRLLVFIDELAKTTEYSFTMRAVTIGSFAVPPLAAEGMYDSGVYFVGETGKNVTIQ